MQQRCSGVPVQKSTIITFATLAPLEMLAKLAFGFFQQGPMCVASGSDLPDICDTPCRLGFRAWCVQHAVDSVGSETVAAVNNIGDWFAGFRALVSRHLRRSGFHEGNNIMCSFFGA